jgi:hypothetical protein
MAWVQIETGARNVQESVEDGVKWRLVSGYDITADNYRVHVYKLNPAGLAEKLDIDLTAATLHEGFELGKQVIRQLQ